MSFSIFPLAPPPSGCCKGTSLGSLGCGGFAAPAPQEGCGVPRGFPAAWGMLGEGMLCRGTRSCSLQGGVGHHSQPCPADKCCSLQCDLPLAMTKRAGSRSVAVGHVPPGLKTSSSPRLQQKIQSLVETAEQKQLQGKTLWINVSRGVLRVLFVLFNFTHQLLLRRKRILGRDCEVPSPNGAGKLERSSEICEDHRKAWERWTAAWERRQKEGKIKGRCGLLRISQ